jgi:predicted transcriptional regulator
MSLYNLVLSDELRSNLKNFAAEFNLNMSEVVRMAIIEFIKNHKSDIINENGEFVKGDKANA